MVLQANQVELRRNSTTLLMGPGTPYTVLPGWDPWSRTNRTPQTVDRPYAHGSLVGSEWVDAATVLIPVSVYRNLATQAQWMAAHQQLMAAFTAVGSSGEVCELRFEWGGTEYVMFGRPVQVRVTADNISVGKSVQQCAFIAADPRVYFSELSTFATGLPVQQGGLTVPFAVPVTVPGRLVGGFLDLVNNGTAAAGLTVRIEGPAVEPRLIVRGPGGTVQSIRILVDLLEGQWVTVDTTRRLALLNDSPDANLRGASTWDMDAYPLQPGASTLRFLSAEYDPASQLTVSYRSAWW